MPGAPAFCSTRLSASARFPRDKHCSHRARLGGVNGGAIRRRIVAALWPVVLGLHLWTFPTRTPKGLAAVNATTTSTNVLTLGFAFGPSQPPSIPLVIRPLLTSPQRASASRPCRPAPPNEHADRRGWASGTPVEISPNKTSGLPRAPTAFTDGPLMDIGLRHAEPARPDRPALYTVHLFLGSRFRLRLPSHPPHGVQLPLACGWCHQPPQGTFTPKSLVMSGVLG